MNLHGIGNDREVPHKRPLSVSLNFSEMVRVFNRKYLTVSLIKVDFYVEVRASK